MKSASRLRSFWKPLLLLPILLLLRWSFIEQLDALAFDFALRLRGGEAPDERIVIVAIDDGSLARIGPWPWSRSTQTKLFSRILDADPALLGVDILLPTLGEHPQLETSSKVVLATALGTADSSRVSSLVWQEPTDWDKIRGPSLGHIHADKDVDGVCRSIPLSIVENGQRRWAFSVELARLYWGVEPDQVAFQGTELLIAQHSIPRLDHPIDSSVDSLGVLASLPGDHLLINSRGGPRTFPHLSAADLLTGDSQVTELLRDKIVLLGATSYSLGDHLATAFSGPSEMPGVEIHANALDTILNQRFLTTTSELEVSLLLAFAIAWTWFLMERMQTWTLPAFLGSLAGAVTLTLLLLNLFSHWIPMASLVIAIVATGGLAQFSRYSALNRQLTERFTRLSDLVSQSTEAQQPFAPEEGSFRLKSLEWKLDVLAEATDQALQLADVKQEMLSFVAHELKTPLASISGFSELLLRPGRLSEEERRESLELIRQEAARLSNMANDYLRLARLEQRVSDLPFEECDLQETLASACRLVEPQMVQAGVTLGCPDRSPEVLLVQGIGEHLTEVFVNLMGNAAKYSHSGARVSVDLHWDSDKVTISVADQGFGIAQDEQAQIFRKFFRGSLPEGRTRSGSGLGLALVKRVIELHMGSIEVESRPGRGSTFRVTLPRITRSA